MKRTLSLILALTMALGVCFAFAGCTSSDVELEYGDKYTYESYFEDADAITAETKIGITLNDDNTGKYEYYLENTFKSDELSGESYVISGTINFEWAETSDGGIHLFETKITYDKKSTEGKTFSLPTSVLYYSEDVLYFAGDNTKKFIREGADLYDTVFDDATEK